MGTYYYQSLFLFSFVLLYSICCTQQLQSSQVQTLLRIKDLLNSPPFLSTWNNYTDFCNFEPTSSLTVVCYENSVTQLHIIGNNGTQRLPDNFSIDSFVTTLVKLPSLKVLKLVSLGLWGALPGKFMRLTSLEILNLSSNFFEENIPQSISSLSNLQTLILENNSFNGTIPEGLGKLSGLAVLNVKSNNFHGSLPHSIGNLENLRVLVMSYNNFSGEVPDLSGLTNLQVLDLESNVLGPQFPVVADKVESIVLRNNKFTNGVPDKVQSYYQLKVFDVSMNRFVGPFPLPVLSLPSLTYLDISQNKFTGMLSQNLTCGNEVDYLNLTSNLLTGNLPSCLTTDSKKRDVVVQYGDNCLETGDGNQQPVSFCKNAAIAVGILPHAHKQKRASKLVLALSISAGVIGVVVLVGATFLLVKNFLAKRAEEQKPQTTLIIENPSTGYTSKMLKDARYITQTMKLGALGLPAYRTFSLEELETATRNFDTSTFMGQSSHGQMYKGQLRDGSHIAIRCLKLKKNHNTQYFMPHIEMISKLRHQHLVSALGHCFEYCLDDSSVSRVFLIFEYVPNGTLRSWISEGGMQQKLTWTQRIAAVTGVAKGIQFLHTGIVPGLFSNNIKIIDVLVDQNLVAKISSYNLPLLSENMGKDQLLNFFGGSKQIKNARAKHQDKMDIYDFGVILLEVVTGKQVDSINEVQVLKVLLQTSPTADETLRNSQVDAAINTSCSGESLRTVIEICCRCLHEDPSERPSIEDVLWNLQFAAQVQDAWRRDSQSSEGSPISPLQSSRIKPNANQ